MRSKSPELKKSIYNFVNEWKQAYGRSPSMNEIAKKLGVSRGTAHRYLVEMDSEGMVSYDGKSIDTPEFNASNMRLSRGRLVGDIPCGEPNEEESYVEDYINLPENLFGRGEFYLLRAKGDSMEDAGISEGDLVVISIRCEAKKGDIVVALDGEGGNTLKRYGGIDRNGFAILEYMNEEVYPDKKIIVKDLAVQGVASHVIKKL